MPRSDGQFYIGADDESQTNASSHHDEKRTLLRKALDIFDVNLPDKTLDSILVLIAEAVDASSREKQPLSHPISPTSNLESESHESGQSDLNYITRRLLGDGDDPPSTHRRPGRPPMDPHRRDAGSHRRRS